MPGRTLAACCHWFPAPSTLPAVPKIWLAPVPPSCAACTRMLINAGVAKIIVGPGTTSMPAEHFEVAEQMLCEAGVELELAP